MVNILRVQCWDGYSTGYFNGVGGAAVVATNISESYPEVIGVFGEYDDMSTIAAIVYDSDDVDSVGSCLNIRSALFEKSINVVLFTPYQGLTSTDEDLLNVAHELKKVNARYVILCAQGWSRSYDLVRLANTTGLISPENVWISTTLPYPMNFDFGSTTDSRIKLLQGFVVPTVLGELSTDPNFVEIQNNWERHYNETPWKYQVPFLDWANQGSYDCIGTMLYGFDKVSVEIKRQFDLKNAVFT
ncbi:UNVERIFIED_CONTAM: hypothetical protein HDU68_004110 [Siphonaria sp. JEL0065]|nr:hypothetical protein HDU68_004110 [Siphonaria sp. JEL0065]